MRIAIGVSYEGSPFEGWQSQPSGNTIQDHLERALGSVAGEPVRMAAAGRTDAGVHALAQVAHFDTGAVRRDYSWVRGANAHLPPEIAVQWAQRVDDQFHARFSAEARSYRYLLYNHAVRPALWSRHAGWHHAPLDLAAMQAAAAALVGTHDFSSFRSSECQARTPVRTLESFHVTARGACIAFDLTANGFLHHMVRNIMGALVDVGRRRREPAWMTELLDARDRRLAPPTAAPGGLYLAGVRYAAQWKLPAFARMMDLP